MRWTEEQKLFLIENYPQKGKMWCCEKLNLSELSIRYMASKLNLRQDRKGPFFKEWQKKAALSKIGKKRPQHSLFMKRLVKERMDLAFSVRPRTIQEKRKIGENVKRWQKKYGHPRGMLGKHHTEKVRDIMKNNLKNAWLDPENKVNSKEYRQLLSDRASKLQNLGILNTRYSRSKKGTYDINGKDYFFRSLWEANYALYLDFLIKQKEIIKWEFEVDTFWFEKIKRGVRSYKPDFKIYRNDGGIEYHEVKGWMDKKSITKINRMRIYYPKTKLVIIDENCYKDIKGKVGKMLKFY